MFKPLIASAITAASIVTLATPAVSLTLSLGASSDRPFGTAPESMCLEMRNRWVSKMQRTGEDNALLRTSMEDFNCSYWGIHPPQPVLPQPASVSPIPSIPHLGEISPDYLVEVCNDTRNIDVNFHISWFYPGAVDETLTPFKLDPRECIFVKSWDEPPQILWDDSLQSGYQGTFQRMTGEKYDFFEFISSPNIRLGLRQMPRI